jgi:signal transduction histidine kinase
VGTAVRFSALLGALLLIVLAASTWATWASFSNRTRAEATADLTAAVQAYNRSLVSVPADRVDAATISYLSATVLPSGEQLVVSLPGGRRYGTTNASNLLGSPQLRALAKHPPSSTSLRTLQVQHQTLDVLVTPIRQGGAVVGSVVSTYDLGPALGDQRRVLELVVIEAMIALVAAVLGSYLLLRRLLGTVGRITKTAQIIEEGELDRRLGDQGTDDEVGELAATFDAMLDRLDEVMGLQRQLLADVSHQLKTPLTVIRGHLEVMARSELDDAGEIRATVELVVAEIEHMRQLTEQLLLLGHSLEADFIVVAPVDVRSFAGDLLASAEVLGDRRFQAGTVEDLLLLVDEPKLRGAVLNLLDNAVKATDLGAVIELSVTRGPAGVVSISVDDAGPGIAPVERERVLARFGRPDHETREGTGLGLAIVGAVAEAHGGTLELGESRWGGLSARVLLPPSVVISEVRADIEIEQGVS